MGYTQACKSEISLKIMNKPKQIQKGWFTQRKFYVTEHQILDPHNEVCNKNPLCSVNTGRRKCIIFNPIYNFF